MKENIDSIDSEKVFEDLFLKNLKHLPQFPLTMEVSRNIYEACKRALHGLLEQDEPLISSLLKR